MATIQGSAGGQTLILNTSASAQQAVAQVIFASAAASVYNTATATTGGPADASGNYYSVVTAANSKLQGDPDGTGTQYVLLDGSDDIYLTNGAVNSVVAAADDSNATIVNKSAGANLVAATGAGDNVLAGLAGHNSFTTGAGGVDAIVLKGTTNTLDSYGNDTVAAVGPSAIYAGSTATDTIAVGSGATLSFTNASAAPRVDSIQGATGSTITIAGPGNTSVTAGSGPEVFYVDTAAGNVTLNAKLSTSDSITFVKDSLASGPSTANITVTNFTLSDMINLHGYAGTGYSLSSNTAGFAVLNLSDGSTVSFSNVTAAQLQGKIKID